MFHNTLNKSAFNSGEQSTNIYRKVYPGDLTPSPYGTSNDNSYQLDKSNNSQNSNELVLNESLRNTQNSSADKVIFQGDSPHPFLGNVAWKQKKNVCKTQKIYP